MATSRRTFSAEAISRALADAGLLVAQHGHLPERFSIVSDDSRQVQPGGLFIAVRGSARDGHDFLAAAEAAERGRSWRIRVAPVCPRLWSAKAGRPRRWWQPPRMGFRPHSPRGAVTGTNGKSTTVSLLRHLFDAPDAPAASIGTIGVFVGSVGRSLDGGGGLTTPGPIELQRIPRLVDQGVRAVALEALSHSLDQQRVGSLAFDAAVFTNLTRDHLDYHRTMEAYLAAKARLLQYLRPGGVSVVNADDAAWRSLPGRADGALLGAEARCGCASTRRTLWTAGQRMATGNRGGPVYPVRLPLIGDFNVANALGAAAAAWALGLSPRADCGTAVQRTAGAGRLEVLHEHPMVLRDYAHTPDALERALEAVAPS